MGDVTPAQVRWRAAAVGVGAALVAVGAGARAPTAAAAGVLAGAGAAWFHARHAGRTRVMDERDLAQAFALLEAELTAGAREGDALAAAAQVAGRHAARLSAAAATARMGGDVGAALDDVDSSPGLGPLAAAWRVRAGCGAPLADVVGRVSRDLELRRARERDVDAALAGPRSSSAMLAVLPGLGLGLGAAMGAHPVDFLFATPVGSGVLLVGVLADVLGCAWIGVLVRRARR